MKKSPPYKSYNSTKTVDELMFNLLNYELRIKSLKIELDFILFVIDTAHFKEHVINLFEILSVFITDVKDINSAQNIVLNKISKTSKTLYQKRECEDLICDDFFIKDYDLLEKEILHFLDSVTNLKADVIPYLQSVIIKKK